MELASLQGKGSKERCPADDRAKIVCAMHQSYERTGSEFCVSLWEARFPLFSMR
jgi:hypothetical protein